MLLEPIYEQDFLDCSYGFRRGRSAHQAVQALRDRVMKLGGCWLIEIDIQSYFDTLDKGKLREMLQRRVRDGVLLRLIGKWLNAGILEEGVLKYSDSGTPQGGVISPILSNLYLHDVLDVWFEREVKPRLKGEGFLIRFADDSVLGFALESDARRVLEVLPKRFDKYGLTLHPEKTRLIDFRKPCSPPGQTSSGAGRRPGTFDLLGFTHYWSRSMKGNWVVKRKTAKGRLSRAIRRVAAWCRKNRHLPIREQHRMLCQKLRGHYEYYGITGNSKQLGRFKNEVQCRWRKWLARRSQRSKGSWEWFNLLLGRYPLPPATCVHSVLRHAVKP
jgi:group II intron reverse transcriptase/maturase